MLRALSAANPRCCLERSLRRYSNGSYSARGIDNFTSDQIEAAERDPIFPIIISEDGTHTLRKRRKGCKPLPLPPHMDPIRRAQRNRWKRPKAPPLKYEDMSQFQKDLWNNPYARALATPVRACAPTQARLPSFFLIPFKLKRTSDDDGGRYAQAEHSLVPQRLLDDANGVAFQSSSRQRSVLAWERMMEFLSQSHGTKRSWGSHILLGSDQEWQDVKADAWDVNMQGIVLAATRAPVNRELRDLLGQPSMPSLVPYVNGKMIGEDVACVLLFYQDSQQDPASQLGSITTAHGLSRLTETGHGEPNEDVNSRLFATSDTVSDQELDKLEAELQVIADRSNKEVTKEVQRALSLQAASNKTPRGATTTADVPQLSVESRQAPLSYPTMLIGSRLVPVYDLVALLGLEDLERLLEGTGLQHEKAAIVLHSTLTVDLEMALLRLQNYLAKPC